MENRTIVVIGASGLIGRATLKKLTEDWPSANIRGVARTIPESLHDQLPGVVLCKGDVERPESLCAAFDGVTDLVLSLSGRSGIFQRIEHQGAVEAAKLAISNGARRIIYVSGTSTPAAPHWFEAGIAKQKAERDLQALAASVTILRPSWLMESLGRMVRNNKMSLIGAGDAAVHWLSAHDLANVISDCLSQDLGAAGAFPVLGPQAIRIEDAAARYAKANGMDSPPQHMPLAVAKIVSVFVKELRPITELSRMFKTFDETTLATHPTPFARPQQTLAEWLE